MRTSFPPSASCTTNGNDKTVTLGTFLLAELVKGFQIPWRFLPDGINLRYMQLKYTVTGTATGLTHGRMLTADAAVYAIAATDAALLAGRVLGAGAASYAMTATTAALTRLRLGARGGADTQRKDEREKHTHFQNRSL